MGCDGCELWPTWQQIRTDMMGVLDPTDSEERDNLRAELNTLLEDRSATEIWHKRHVLIDRLAGQHPAVTREAIENAMTNRFRCYAGQLHLNRGENTYEGNRIPNKGYARIFEEPRCFPGRMEDATRYCGLSSQERAKKPWLDGCRPLIFISDMGDALSESIGFDFLETEIIASVSSEKGSRSIWLWLTKRPRRMADFGAWLQEKKGKAWPDNLMAMTSVTNRATKSRIAELKEVPASLRGLSVEPLVESVELGSELEGIHWLIAGGESGQCPRPFKLSWARNLKRQCTSANVPFFLKQLGSSPVEEGIPLSLRHAHGGNWEEWPEDLRVRQMPRQFKPCGSGPTVGVTSYIY